MADTLDPRYLFFNDGHGAAVARNNAKLQDPAKAEDIDQLEAARAYIADHLSGHSGHLTLEGDGHQFRWTIRIGGNIRWQSPTNFRLTTFKPGTRLEFPNPPSQ